MIDIIFLLFLSELVAKCLPNQAQFKVFPTLNLDELPSNVVITSTDGEIQQICLQELLTWVKNPGGDSKEKRRRSKSHNKNIGMKASLNAIWKALIVEKDEKKHNQQHPFVSSGQTRHSRFLYLLCDCQRSQTVPCVSKQVPACLHSKLTS